MAITVEGANILTRSLMILGQGAIRCHPYVLREMNAAKDKDKRRSLREFDQALFGHIGYTLSNAARSFVMAADVRALLGRARHRRRRRRYYQHVNKFSAQFAFATDMAMLTLGGYLKQKEHLSARLGDVLSSLYMASMVLKHYENQGRPEADLPLVEWSCRTLLYKAQEQLHDFLRNFPNRLLAGAMRLVIFPRGRTYFAASDRLGRAIVEPLMMPSATRDRLALGHLPHGRARQSDRPAAGSAGAVRRGRTAREAHPRRGREDGPHHGARPAGTDRAGAGRRAASMPPRPRMLREYDRKVMDIINVDDFSGEELMAAVQAEPKESGAARLQVA